MLTLALTCLRVGLLDETVRLLVTGQLSDAVDLGKSRLDKRTQPGGSIDHDGLGQALGLALITMGREEEAEDLFHRQLRLYEAGERSHLRWMSSLDQGAMQMALNRPSRAATAYNQLADDETAPAPLRIEALAGLAIALRSLGEFRRSTLTIDLAQSLAAELPDPRVAQLLTAIQRETQVLRDLLTFDEVPEAMSPSSMASIEGEAVKGKRQLLTDSMEALASMPIAVQRLRFLHALADETQLGREHGARLYEAIHEIRRSRLDGLERQSRIEAALSLVRHGDLKAAQETVAVLARDEEAMRRHRHSLELRYCMASIYSMQGRHADALRLHKEFSAQVLGRLRTELSQLPYTRCLERLETQNVGDPMRLSLPLRYRRAYAYIIEHLHDRDLSVRQIAAHVEVTERALQMAFRNNIGMTPVELIRRKRLERIRRELREAPERPGVLDVAQHWGLTNRSTLTHSYRQLYNESPTSMLNGGARRPDMAVQGGAQDDLA